MEENENELSLEIYKKLESLGRQIKNSFSTDSDMGEYIKESTEIIKEILSKDSMEEYFNNDQKIFNYFLESFLKDMIFLLTHMTKIDGEKGDELALDFFLHILKLFLKFHKKDNYSPLFERLREIFSNNNFFFNHRNDDGKGYDLYTFNSEYCSEFQKEIKKFEIGQEIDFPYEEQKGRYEFLKNVWLRGKIEDIRENHYVINFCENEKKYIDINNINIFEKGKKTIDWDWRLSLKKYDVIDCFDRNKWYPATILSVKEKEINGYKRLKYKVSFRLYTEHFLNPNEETDTYENHIDIWKTYNRIDVNIDEDGEKYIGDGSNCDEDIIFYSKRIQKFGTYSSIQQKYIDFNYSFNTSEDNELKRASDALASDTEVDMEDNFFYEKDGKKNYILGKYENQFYYIYAKFLKLIEKNNGYDELLEILKNNPNTEEIYNTFYILLRSFPFLHSGYFLENGNCIKSSCINYINSLDEKNIRKIPKELNNLVSKLIYQINEYSYKEEKESEGIDIYDEITLAFAMKSIKTNIFDYRLKGIKDLNGIIEKNKNDKDTITKIILIIKENKILNEIFGANYHSQLIKISNEIIKLLLKENALDENDMTLIWSCTKRGDLEAKLTIMKLLSSLTKNLNENHIEMLLNSVITNVDKKINSEEIDLVYNLATQDLKNEKNLMHCCDYLCQIFFEIYPQSPNIDEDAKKILDKIMVISFVDDKYLKKILSICENGIEKNKNCIQCYNIIIYIFQYHYMKINNGGTLNSVITEFTKENHIINLFENNFKMYLAKAKEILEKNKIPFTEGETISKYIIDDFTHNDNIQKRLDILPLLINEYPDYDFLSFLKNILIINPINSNDQLIFYDFIKKFISGKYYTTKISEENRKKIKQEIFELISKDEQSEINLEQLKLFIAIFLDINKEKIILEENKENEIKEVLNINDLIGLDKLWNIIFRIDDEKVLSYGISIIYQIYKDNNMEKLFEKCNSIIKDENSKKDEKLMEKYITLMKSIIIESEKNILFMPKSHLSLLKNCFINLPFEIKGKEVKIRKDLNKFIIFGNTNLIDAKILISKIYEIPLHLIQFSLSKNFLKILKKNAKEDLALDESYNNISLYELLIQNDKDSNLTPKDKLKFSTKKPEEEKLLINGEINPKLRKIFQEWFVQFTEGTMQMDAEGTARFISGVTPSKAPVSIHEQRVINFLKEDLEGKGYVNEEEFIHFFEKALKDPRKCNNVWNNLESMGIGKDLKKMNEKIENLEYYENEKLPRYKLGNDLIFVENLIKKYYENPEKNFYLIDFLFFLTTNEKVYNDILENLLNEMNNDNIQENNENFLLKAFKEKNKYVELDYIFIIIESILQDFEAITINDKLSDKNDFINLGNESYKLVSSKYEPFDNDEKNKKKSNFMKRLIKSDNLQKIINHVNDSLESFANLLEEKDSTNMNTIIYDFCLRGINLLNTLYNFCSIKNEKENSKLNIRQTGVYHLGLTNLSQFLEEFDFLKEFETLSYKNLADNLIKILTKSPSAPSTKEENKENIEEKENYLKKECFDLFIKILSSNKNLLENYKDENDTQKNEINKLFINKFTENESKNKEIFIQNIINSVDNAERNQNKNYIEFLSKLVNNLLDNLINPENKVDSQNDKNQFAPDNSFFEIYNHLHKLNSVDNKNTINESALKIYDLIIKNIRNGTYKNKLFLSLLQLLNLQIPSNEEMKEKILFTEYEYGKNFFNFLFEHAMPELLTLKEEKKEELISTENNDTNNRDKKEQSQSEDKFILLENMKEEKKNEPDDNLTEELSQICNEFILNCFNDTSNPKIISQLLNIIYLQRKYDKKNNKTKNQFYNNNYNQRNKAFELASKDTTSNLKKFGHVGLKNLGCICYMNSIMQQMYMVPTFRYAIMSADDHKDPKDPDDYMEISDDNLLHQLQKMYTYLTYSNKSSFAPREFCYSYKDLDGHPTNVRMQQDSQEFYNNFCDKIENSLKITKYKYIVSDVFMGQSCSSVECSNCKNISNRFEDFYNLTLEVKNINNLNDSLQKMGVPEIIDDFKCSHCNQKVTISKITSLNKLPNVLVVHLKRFYLNYEVFKTMKINSKFEFPKKLNLKQFCVSEIQKNSENKNNNDEIYIHNEEYYEYELKGINVHTGSADGGHYFSFIDVNREGKNNKINNYPKEYWLQFNDSKVSEFDTETIPKECYGGNYEGYAFENIQNAYLLIYERKIKMPIRVLYEKNDIDKIKKENNDLIIIKKENRNEINKKYDLSRINNNDIKEEDLYKKIFFDEEKDEYYKYIPFYNVPKYAPRKVYNEIMKENNTQEDSSDLNDNKFQINQQKYGQVLSNLIQESKLDINDNYYDDKMKESAIVSILDELLISIKEKDKFVGGEEGNTKFNDAIFYIFNNLIKPLVKKETSEELLKTIFEMIYNNIFLKFIFTSRYIDSNNYLDKVTNKSNAKLVMEIMFEFVKIFFETKKNYRNIGFFMALLEIIKKSNKVQKDYYEVEDSTNDKYEYTIIFAYELLDKIIHLHDDILKYLVDRQIISILAGKLPLENEEIKKIIYKDLNYIIKSSSEYTKELFDLAENEKEGRNIICSQEEIIAVLNEGNILKCLIYEDIELFIILLVISSKDDIIFLRNFFYMGITQLFDYLIEEKKVSKEDCIINYILKIFYSLAIVNGDKVLQRLQHVLGYPNPIILDIQHEEDSPKSQKQKWPIFGEKLINGNIDKQIYEFVNINHRNKILCLLRLLLPNENDEIKIPEETVKKYIIKLIENCLGEKENYSLFKYFYLNPGRSLRYENLYQEMKHFVMDKDKDYNFERFSERESKFIEQIQKEVESSIKELKEEDNNPDEEMSDDENPPPLSSKMSFNCHDENMKKFIGFNCNIIPGDIVREEIVQIASGDYLAMFRLEYYTKYYDAKELREKLLHPEIYENNKDQKNIKEEKKEEPTEKIDTENPKPEEMLIDKEIDKKEEKEEKVDDKEKKSDEKDPIENKEENKKEEDDKENKEVKEEEKKEEEKIENPKNEAEEKKENPEEENKTEQKEEEGKQNDNTDKSQVSIEIPKESEPNPEEEKNQEEIQENKKEDSPKEEEKRTKKEEQKEETEKSSEEETKENTPLETDINDTLEVREKYKNRTVKKYDVSSVSEDQIIYNVLPKRESSIILEDESIKDRNKVKRVLFRYIFTNKSDAPKNFRAITSTNSDLTKLTKNNCCLIPRFIFDKVKEENITNFYNVMRIRGDLPFMERDDSAVSIDITSDINFNKG